MQGAEEVLFPQSGTTQCAPASSPGSCGAFQSDRIAKPERGRCGAGKDVVGEEDTRGQRSCKATGLQKGTMWHQASSAESLASFFKFFSCMYLVQWHPLFSGCWFFFFLPSLRLKKQKKEVGREQVHVPTASSPSHWAATLRFAASLRAPPAVPKSRDSLSYATVHLTPQLSTSLLWLCVELY